MRFSWINRPPMDHLFWDYCIVDCCELVANQLLFLCPVILCDGWLWKPVSYNSHSFFLQFVVAWFLPRATFRRKKLITTNNFNKTYKMVVGIFFVLREHFLHPFPLDLLHENYFMPKNVEIVDCYNTVAFLSTCYKMRLKVNQIRSDLRDL